VPARRRPEIHLHLKPAQPARLQRILRAVAEERTKQSPPACQASVINDPREQKAGIHGYSAIARKFLTSLDHVGRHRSGHGVALLRPESPDPSGASGSACLRPRSPCRALQRRGSGRIPSVLLVVLLSLLLVGGVGLGLVLQIKRLAADLPQYKDNIAHKIAGLRDVGQGTVLQDLVELHGGEVRVNSEGLGHGAKFTISLPVEPEPAAPVEAMATEGCGGVRCRILLVEDNRDAADSLRLLLEMYRHEVAMAYSGPEGVEVARQFRPDVVLSDLGLPGMDGYAVATALRQDPATPRPN
jgi:hypothetical protein